MNFKNIKVRHIAYSFGVLLVILASVNYFAFQYVNISANEVFAVNKSVEMEGIAQRLNFALKILSKSSDAQEVLQEDLKELNKMRAEYQAAYSLLQSGGTILVKEGLSLESYEVAPAPSELQAAFGKLERDWKQYQEDMNGIMMYANKDLNNESKDINWLPKKYQNFLEQNKAIREGYQSRLASKKQLSDVIAWAILAFNFLAIIGIYISVRNLVMIPIGMIARNSRQLALGNLSQKVNYNYKSEIGYIAQNVDDLADMLKNATDFSKEIGQGNLEAEYKGALETKANSDNSLIGALQSMRSRLLEVAEKDRQERWVNTGLAKFADILRNSSNENIYDLSYRIISSLVTYLEASQGILFVMNDDSPNDANFFLQSTACYALNKRKVLDKKVTKGEGLVGQAFLDKEMIYIDDVPQNYEKISSALGETRPRSILIVPLMMNENIQGAVEVLSLKPIAPYQRNFVQRVAENIASTIAIVKNNMKTKQLLMESEELEKRVQRRG